MIPIADLDTPALLVDVPRLDHNIATMQRLADRCGVALRPHTKTHKAPAIARRQLVAGARGLTVAKVGEAEVLVAAGCEDLLIAYPLIGTVKYERLARLLDRATIRVAADSPAGVAALSAFFGPRGHQLPVLIEVDTGFRRTGVQTADEALALAAAVAAAPGLVFGGLLEFSGQTYGACSEAERRTLGQAAGSRLVEIGQHLAARGLPPPVLSTGATPALPASAEVAGITEIRPGVYVFGDLKQVELGTIRREQCALTVLATVVSQPAPGRYILDSGTKALSSDHYAVWTYGELKAYPGVAIARASEEHGIVENGALPLHIGDKVEVIPNHACATCNMHDELYAVVDGQVVDTWPIRGRGKFR